MRPQSFATTLLASTATVSPEVSRIRDSPQLEPSKTEGRICVRRSPINGKGCFALVLLAARKSFGEFIGEKISAREAGRRVARGGKISICDLDDRWSIDASRSGKPTAFINHSCAPNSFMRVAQGKILFYALRDIPGGEEITLDYTPSQHPGRPCTCRAPGCHGVMR
ncbi:MAG: SET domain-containing protein [Chthoniobacterales bacterium]